MTFNPFTAREAVTSPDPQMADSVQSPIPEYAVPQHGSYAVPGVEAGGPFTNTFGWAPGQRVPAASPTEYPSAQRLGSIPRYTFGPDPDKPAEYWYGYRDLDDKHRHSVEDIDADGWTESKGITNTDLRWAPNPRLTPQPETRLTQQMAPRTYSFTRPFDTGYARTFNGMHFSMADHRRKYDVLGMAPVRTSRNTFRQAPVPWDTDVIDIPGESQTAQQPDYRLVSPELPPSRSWRL